MTLISIGGLQPKQVKEAIKLAFFRLVEYVESQHLRVRLKSQNGQKQRTFFWNLSVHSCSEKWRLFDAKYSQETYDLVQCCVLLQTGSTQNRKRSGRYRCTTEQEDKFMRVSSLRNRRLTSPQLAASLNSTAKHHVQHQLWKGDSGMLAFKAEFLCPVSVFFWPS
jgi:uncharacterized protein YifE (UPF0438 family)